MIRKDSSLRRKNASAKKKKPESFKVWAAIEARPTGGRRKRLMFLRTVATSRRVCLERITEHEIVGVEPIAVTMEYFVPEA